MTAAEKAKLEDADAKWVRPEQALIDRWNTLCEIATYNYLTPTGSISRKSVGQYNESTGYFEAYDHFFDIDAQEAMNIIEFSNSWLGEQDNANNPFGGNYFHCSPQRSNARIQFPMPVSLNISLRGIGLNGNPKALAMCYYYHNRPVPVSNLRQYNVEWCPTPMDVSSIDWSANYFEGFYDFGNTGRIKYILLHNLKCDLPLQRCPYIEMECIEYAVSHAANEKPITITLHPDVYARLTDELIVQAAEKQITFATT